MDNETIQMLDQINFLLSQHPELSIYYLHDAYLVSVFDESQPYKYRQIFSTYLEEKLLTFLQNYKTTAIA